MSRALNVQLPKTDVIEACEKLGILVSAVESLIPSGTRVVCRTSEGALALRTKFRTKLIEGSIQRVPRSIASSAMRF